MATETDATARAALLFGERADLITKAERIIERGEHGHRDL